MKVIKTIASLSCLSTLLSILATTSALAGTPGPFINYGPLQGAQAVPTLSGTMLVVLSLLLVVVAIRITKQKGQQTRKLFITLIGVTALASGFSGVKLISDVEAIQAGTVLLSDDADGTHQVSFQNGVINTVTNTTPSVLKIFSISYDTCPNNDIANKCNSGATLQANANCQIDCVASETSVVLCLTDEQCEQGQFCSTEFSDEGICTNQTPQ